MHLAGAPPGGFVHRPRLTCARRCTPLRPPAQQYLEIVNCRSIKALGSMTRLEILTVSRSDELVFRLPQELSSSRSSLKVLKFMGADRLTPSPTLHQFPPSFKRLLEFTALEQLVFNDWPLQGSGDMQVLMRLVGLRHLTIRDAKCLLLPVEVSMLTRLEVGAGVGGRFWGARAWLRSGRYQQLRALGLLLLSLPAGAVMPLPIPALLPPPPQELDLGGRPGGWGLKSGTADALCAMPCLTRLVMAPMAVRCASSRRELQILRERASVEGGAGNTDTVFSFAR
jgi:hypothetical protein